MHTKNNNANKATNRKNKLFSYMELSKFCKGEGINPSHFISKHKCCSNTYHKEQATSVLLLPY